MEQGPNRENTSQIGMRGYTDERASTYGAWAVQGSSVVDVRCVIPCVRKVLTEKKQKKPASEERWRDYGVDLKWVHTWKLKSQYTTPRDTVALLQLQHRNLYVAKSRGSQTHDARHTDATTRRTKHASSDTNGLLGANEQGNCRTGDFKERKITKHTG